MNIEKARMEAIIHAMQLSLRSGGKWRVFYHEDGTWHVTADEVKHSPYYLVTPDNQVLFKL